jgi:hypothetical protein
VHEQQTDD